MLPYGQMSLWGWPLLKAPNTYLIQYNFIFIMQGCLEYTVDFIISTLNSDNIALLSSIISVSKTSRSSADSFPISEERLPPRRPRRQDKTQLTRIRANKRIGPHNKNILNILFGSLLGDCHAEFRHKGNGTRFCFYQENSHVAYLLWLHNLLSELDYCHSKLPEINTRLGTKGIVRKIIRFKTWTYSSLNWVHDLWYINNIKVVPATIGDYLDPLALAIWIMDDGGKMGTGLKLCTNSFTYSDCILLVRVLHDNFNLKSTIHSAGVTEQYIIYIWKESMPLLRQIVLPYVHPSMKYKITD